MFELLLSEEFDISLLLLIIVELLVMLNKFELRLFKSFDRDVLRFVKLETRISQNVPIYPSTHLQVATLF